MIIGAVPYILGCLANIHPSYGLTVPAFGLIGVGAALIWTGQAVRATVARACPVAGAATCVRLPPCAGVSVPLRHA